MRKRGGYINPMTKREKAEMALDRIKEKEAKLALAKKKREADLLLLNDEDDGFKVRVSLADFEVLKQAKLASRANPLLFAQFQAPPQQP